MQKLFQVGVYYLMFSMLRFHGVLSHLQLLHQLMLPLMPEVEHIVDLHHPKKSVVGINHREHQKVILLELERNRLSVQAGWYRVEFTITDMADELLG